MTNRALTGLALLCAATVPAHAVEVTANVGFMSEYIFRGTPQERSSAMGGLDLEASGLYLGTWAADVGEGLEVDLYGGYRGSVGDFNFGIGATGYFYTDDFDDDYTELNLSLGYGIFSIDAAFGRYGNFEESSLDYSWVAPKVEYNGFYGLVGIFGRDFDGEYYELGYGSTLDPIGVDWTIALIYSTDTLLGTDSGETSLTLSFSKTFELLK